MIIVSFHSNSICLINHTKSWSGVTIIKFAYLLPKVEDPPPPELALMAETRGCPLCNYPTTKNSQICHRIRFNPSPPRKKFPQRIKDNSAQSLFKISFSYFERALKRGVARWEKSVSESWREQGLDPFCPSRGSPLVSSHKHHVSLEGNRWWESLSRPLLTLGAQLLKMGQQLSAKSKLITNIHWTLDIGPRGSFWPSLSKVERIASATPWIPRLGIYPEWIYEADAFFIEKKIVLRMWQRTYFSCLLLWRSQHPLIDRLSLLRATTWPCFLP